MRGRFFDLDFGLLAPTFVLNILSLTTLFSINIALFRSQLLFLFFSFFVFVIFSRFDYRAFRLYSLPIYIGSITLLFLLLLFGSQSRGAVRWFELFGIQIQFSEILKPFLIISLAAFISQRRENGKTFLLVLGLLVPLVLLIYRQPDLGNALIYLIVAILTLFTSGFSVFWFIGGFILIAVSSPVIWRFLHDYQRKRLMTFINPTGDPLGASYNAIQSIIAVGSGMILGRGIGGETQSRLKFLPERHTDFIFATISEKFGFLVSVLILVCFAFLLYRIYVIFVNSPDKFCKIFCIACFFMILVQVFMNIGMNIGIVPVVGVTLPFVSYGGSSLLASYIILGLLSSISKTYKNREVLEIK
ncbi:MAG: rod shape-determining protein RodA [Patescibacteria group bacterium]|nr:rod shape-determining protein RodA [Patescibacteria group bacterium]